jgi:hypothetical protein
MGQYSSCHLLSGGILIETLADVITAWLPISWLLAARSRRWLILYVPRRRGHDGSLFSESKQLQKPFIRSIWFCQILFTCERGTQHLFDSIF